METRNNIRRRITIWYDGSIIPMVERYHEQRWNLKATCDMVSSHLYLLLIYLYLSVFSTLPYFISLYHGVTIFVPPFNTNLYYYRSQSLSQPPRRVPHFFPTKRYTFLGSYHTYLRFQSLHKYCTSCGYNHHHKPLFHSI